MRPLTEGKEKSRRSFAIAVSLHHATLEKNTEGINALQECRCTKRNEIIQAESCNNGIVFKPSGKSM